MYLNSVIKDNYCIFRTNIITLRIDIHKCILMALLNRLSIIGPYYLQTITRHKGNCETECIAIFIAIIIAV